MTATATARSATPNARPHHRDPGTRGRVTTGTTGSGHARLRSVLVAAEIAKWGPVVQKADMKAE